MPKFAVRSSTLRGGDTLRSSPTVVIPDVEPIPPTLYTPTTPGTGRSVQLFENVTIAASAPTLGGAHNLPVGWQPTSETRAVVGRLQVVIDGVDVTFLEDVPTVVEEYSFAQPFGDLHCVLRFPTLHPFSAWPAWMDEASPVALYLVDENDVRISDDAVWEGILEDPEDSFDDKTGETTVTCIGVVWQANDYVRLGGVTDNPTDIGARITSQFSLTSRPHGKWNEPAPFSAGIASRRHGEGERVLEFIQALFPEANDETRLLTVTTARPRTPKVMWKDTTTVHWTYRVGNRGLTAKTRARWSESAGVIYTDGIDAGGGRHRGYFVRDDGSGEVWIQPAAYREDLHPFDENATGSLDLDASRLDTSGRRREVLLNVGQGVNRDEARTAAAQYLAWRQDPGRIVSGTLAADPAEGWRGQIREGENLQLQGYRTSNLLVHLAAITVKIGEQGPVTVDWQGSTKALDYPTIADIIARRHELARDPMKRLLGGDQGDTLSKRVPWDPNKSGWIPGDDTNGHRWKTGTSTVACVAATWKTVRFLAAEKETVAFTELHAASGGTGRKFCVVITNREPDPGKLPADPFADGAWVAFKQDADAGYVIHWGQFDSLAGVVEGAGYWPGWESDGDTPTGVHRDEMPWTFSHESVPPGLRQNAYLWASIFVVGGSAAFWGHMLLGPSD